MAKQAIPHPILVTPRLRLRQGFALESVSAMLDHCFGTLGLHRVEVLIDPADAASHGLIDC